MRMWRKRNADSPANPGSAGRKSSFASRPSSNAGTASGCSEQLLDRTSMEKLSLDRPALGDHALRFGQPVEALGQERLQRRRRLQIRSLEQHRQQLLDEERVAACRLDRPAAGVRRQVGLGEQALDEPVRFLGSQRREPQHRPVRTLIEELAAAQAEDEDRADGRSSPARSTRSRNAGSAQWRSSRWTTSGRCRARVSNNLRTAHAMSSAEAEPTPRPTACASASAASCPRSVPASSAIRLSSARSADAVSSTPVACCSSSRSGQ